MISLARHRAFIASLGTRYTKTNLRLYVHSVEWSDRSVPVQKRSDVVVIITNVIRCATDTARAGQPGSTHPIDKVFQCSGSVKGFLLINRVNGYLITFREIFYNTCVRLLMTKPNR